MLSLGAGLAFSADTLPTVADVEKLCKENPAKCTEVKDRIKKACDADPKKCAEVKAKIEEIAVGMGAATFQARINKMCEKCVVMAACPIQNEGRAVIE